MGYGGAQIRDLQQTIEASDCDVVVSATPIDITRVLTVSKPLVRARYELREQVPGVLEEAVRTMLDAQAPGAVRGEHVMAARMRH
jgi:predicted GTPase